MTEFKTGGAVVDQPSRSREKPPLDALEATFIVCFSGFLATIWLAFTLAEFGLDHPRPILILGCLAIAIGLGVTYSRFTIRSSLLHVIAIAVPLLVGIALYFPPDEIIGGNSDPGVYIDTGVTIARTGGIVLNDLSWSRLSAETRQALLFRAVGRLSGFYAVDHSPLDTNFSDAVASTSSVVPHGFHLYPVVLAFGYAVGGLHLEFLVPPLLSLVALLSFNLFVRRVFGAIMATSATLLLAISPAQVWFARYPAAEILTQVLLFAGFFALVIAVERQSRFAMILAGFALGATHLTKLEMLPLPFVLFAYFSWMCLAGQMSKRWLYFILAYLFVLVQAVLHAEIIARVYTLNNLGQALPLSWAVLAAVAVAALSAMLLVAWRVPNVHAATKTILNHRMFVQASAIGLFVVIAVASLYAYYIRPLPTYGVTVSLSNPTYVAVVNDLQSFVRLGWYVSPIGLIVGTLGILLLVHQGIDRRTVVPFVLIGVEAFVFLQGARAAPVHFWAARRWLP